MASCGASLSSFPVVYWQMGICNLWEKAMKNQVFLNLSSSANYTAIKTQELFILCLPHSSLPALSHIPPLATFGPLKELKEHLEELIPLSIHFEHRIKAFPSSCFHCSNSRRVQSDIKES